jgi:Putative glycosyl/glycerophosphate transferases involved in teichoic acid biosynthesis TagF/TagB/EpsJ/RodC
MLCNPQNHIFDLLHKKTGICFDKIIVYAPTYRDYKGAFFNKNVLGYDEGDEKIEKLLEDNNAILIAKFHPMQDISNVRISRRILLYNKSYDYTLYDVLSVSSMLVSDYSSIIHDFILTKKPVVLNFFDEDKYLDTRGFAFDPIDYVCPSEKCNDIDSIVNCIDKYLKDFEVDKSYNSVLDMFHKYKDFHSTERVYETILRIGKLQDK